MNVTLADTKRHRRRIDEITVLLGAPLRRSVRSYTAGTVLNRTSWDCGCVVDCIERSLDPARAVFQLSTCGEHRKIYQP